MPADHLDIAAHELWFARYVAGCLTGSAEYDVAMRLKDLHSRNVLAAARQAVGDGALAGGPCAQTLERAALLAALLHDIGRFAQYRRWRTFADPVSTNHARLGVRICKRCLPVSPLAAESRQVRRLALGAVALHNRLHLPAGLGAEQALAARLLRECDRLDILRLLADMLRPGGPLTAEGVKNVAVLHLPEAAGQVSPAVLEAALAGRPVPYGAMRCRNDYRVLLCGWCQDFTFPQTRGQLRRSGLAGAVLDNLPPLAALAPLRRRTLAALEA